MPTLTDDTTNRGEELMPRRSSRSRRLRHTISALMIVVALPAAITTSQAAASAMPLTASSDAAASGRGGGLRHNRDQGRYDYQGLSAVSGVTPVVRCGACESSMRPRRWASEDDHDEAH